MFVTSGEVRAPGAYPGFQLFWRGNEDFVRVILCMHITRAKREVPYIRPGPARPPPPLECTGAACVFQFSRERGYFGPIVSGRLSRQKQKRGCFKTNPLRYGVLCFIRVSHAFNGLPRNGGRALYIL